MARKIDVHTLAARLGSGYPPPHDAPCAQRERKRLGDAAGLTQFGVNLLRLPPGTWSSQRHWHSAEDELVFIVKGELVLVTDDGEETLRAGDCVGFPANESNGHHLQNRSNEEALVLEVGGRSEHDHVAYSDIDMIWTPATGYAHRDGTPY
jgi:uncharacterized cupin superfamily protein